MLKRKIENELSSTTIIAEQDYENRRGRISDILNELNGPLKSANTSLIAELKQSENDLNELINDESTVLKIRAHSQFVDNDSKPVLFRIQEKPSDLESNSRTGSQMHFEFN